MDWRTKMRHSAQVRFPARAQMGKTMAFFNATVGLDEEIAWRVAFGLLHPVSASGHPRHVGDERALFIDPLKQGV